MANKKTSKRQRDIKSKLVAAICMLLVSSIMMVSSTYAWFTLSTAPEVTGISTQVGANGNLEMALMPAEGITARSAENFGITSEAGDNGKAINLRNITWGNLVDLSENQFYGLNDITLYPAALNLVGDTENGKGSLGASFVLNPEYGADGRPSTLVSKSVTSTYVQNAFPQNSYYGVRAVGTASGMTERQLAYRNYRSSANTSMQMAKSVASTSLNVNGVALANIAMRHAADSANKHTQAEVNSLLAIVDDLLGTDEKVGVLQHIENAYRYHIIALAASANSGLSDEVFNAFKTSVEEADTLDDVMDLLDGKVSLGTTIEGAIAKLKATKGVVTTAQNELKALSGDDITWNQISTPLYRLADTEAMTINDIPVPQVKDRANELMSSMNNLRVTIASGGGVYADVADHCGDYNASIKINANVGGFAVEDLPARMETDTDQDPVYLAILDSAVIAGGAPSSDGGETMPISDMYGYIIDLAFRTNAAESNLLLQTTAANRIYEQNGSEETMGHGSTMTFTSSTTDFTAEQMAGLMGALRIVFFDPSNTNNILGYAMLDMTEGNYTVVGGNQITANIYMYEVTEETTTVTYETASAEQITAAKDGAADAVKIYTADTVDQGAEQTYSEVTDTTTIVDGGTYYVQKSTTTPAGTRFLKDNDAVITSLSQGVAHAVSALVYLDGNYVDNSDVAVGASTSMTGTMNLQFASSAELVPMDYTPLQAQGNAAGGGEGQNP